MAKNKNSKKSKAKNQNNSPADDHTTDYNQTKE